MKRSLGFLAALVASTAVRGSQVLEEFAIRPAAEVFSDPRAAAVADAACRGDAAGIDRAIEAGGDVNAQGIEGVSPLLWALGCDNASGMEDLLRRGANPNLRDEHQATVLYYAARDYGSEFVSLLLRYRADPNIVTSSSYTPLEGGVHRYSITRNRENIDLLVAGGADINLEDSSGQTVVDIACMRNQYDLVNHFLELGYRGDKRRLLMFSSTGHVSPGPAAEWRARVIERLEADLR